MAELPDRKQQSQSFLQALERQRLNKDCLRIIDLRGKVAGECQAYQFGGRVHYLDDRAYLLVKQLMSRFDGRYTTGVYEALFKALKQLDVETPQPEETVKKATLLALDRVLERAEPRIVFCTPVQVRLGDMLYHGHTIDVAVSAVRVSFKRTHSLQRGDSVSVDFVDLFEQFGFDLLHRVSYEIVKIDHDSHYTTAVLARQQQDIFAEWIGQWLETHVSHRQINSDNELINLQSAFYQRLWLTRLTSPVLWLAQAESSHPLLAQHLSPTAYAQMQQSPGWLAQLPLLQLARQMTDVITAFNDTYSFSAPVAQKTAVQKLINWHLSQTDSHLLLLRTKQVRPDPASVDNALSAIESADTTAAEEFGQLCDQLLSRVNIIDLSLLFSNVSAREPLSVSQLASLQTLKSFLEDKLPEPATLDHWIQRDKARFFIHTPVIVVHGDNQWQIDTLDVSADGLAIALPGHAGLALNQRVFVNFERWQSLTSKVRLDAVPYQVKNILHWQGTIRLGLQRVKNNCPESLNSFFDWVIAKNQENLRPKQDDIIKNTQSMLFSQLLLPGLDSIPLFIGLDENGQRQIQVVGTTEANDASKHADLWQAMETQLIRLGEQLKAATSSPSGCFQTTFYAYQSSAGEWLMAFEEDFNHHRDKALFMKRGLSAAEFRIFHCNLTPLKAHDSEQQTDLNTQLQQWRQQRANRVRLIRQQLSQLLGLVELSEISDVVCAYYQG